MFQVASCPPGTLRIGILVDIVRGTEATFLTRDSTDTLTDTENPQTSQQTLLAISNLAKLAPESVLHYILPIFIFVGSNVLHRDDSYSFRVVQKVILLSPAFIRYSRTARLLRALFLLWLSH